MVLKSEQETMQIMIREAITMLCKKHLKWKKNINLEALVGITLDDDDIILVSVRESIKQSTPKKSPMHVALKSVQTAVQRVNAKTAGKKSLEEQTNSQRPSIINIVPTNLPDIEETPVAIGTIQTDHFPGNEISFEFLNKSADEEVVVKEEEFDDEEYGASADSYLVPGTIIKAEELFQTDQAVAPSPAKRKRGRPKLPETIPKKSAKVRKPAPIDDSVKMPRMYTPDGGPPTPLDVRYLGLDRIICEDREFKRGRLLEKLTEQTLKWDELNQHQQNCVFAKVAIRGKEENEIVCSLCYQLFTKAQEYKNHIKSHFVQFSCDVCDKECISQVDLDSHAATHVSFPCPLCNDSFQTKPALTAHIRSEHHMFFQEAPADDSPEAKQFVKEVPSESEPSADKAASGPSNTANHQSPMKANRRDSKQDVSSCASGGKADTVQVKVVPQLSRTGSADSDQEQVVAPKVETTVVTRSRGSLSKKAT